MQFTIRRVIALVLLSNLHLYSWGSSNGHANEHKRHEHQCSRNHDGDEIIVDKVEGVNYSCTSTKKASETEIVTIKSKSWNWDIDAKHRCNIKKMSFRDLYKRYKSGLPPLHYEPVVLYNQNPHQPEEANKCISSDFTYMMSMEKYHSKDIFRRV